MPFPLPRVATRASSRAARGASASAWQQYEQASVAASPRRPRSLTPAGLPPGTWWAMARAVEGPKADETTGRRHDGLAVEVDVAE